MFTLHKKYSLCQMNGSENFLFLWKSLNSGKISYDYKVLLSTNQVETGANLSFSDWEQISPALMKQIVRGKTCTSPLLAAGSCRGSRSRGRIFQTGAKPVGT